MNLKRYWFQFQKFASPSPLTLGAGVTARSYDDALALLKDRVFAGEDVPQIVSVDENIDVSKLDDRHVLPNIGSILRRGIWFPQGYEETRE
jgi:hypothetical protein